MKTRLLIIIGIVVLSAAIIFFSYGDIMLILFDEHYEIEITGLKDTYTTDEVYFFDYHVTGYGDGCAKITATHPDEDGKTTTRISMPSCMVERHFGIINTSSNHGPLGNIAIKIPGTYKISITYDPIGSLLSETVTKEFEITGSPNSNQDEPVFTGTSLFNNNPEMVKRILDHCNSTGVKLSVGLRSSNGTHTIDNNTCEWQTIEKYESDLELDSVLSICEHSVRPIEDNPTFWSNTTHYIDTNNCEWIENENSEPLDIASIEDGHIRLYPVDTCAGIDIDRLTLDELNQRYPATYTTKSGKTYEIKFLSINDDDLKEMPVISELIKATHQIPFPLNGGITASKGLVEDPDWNNYREWYDQKKTEQFDLDEVRVRGFVYNEEYYSIGFSIC